MAKHGGNMASTGLLALKVQLIVLMSRDDTLIDLVPRDQNV